MWSHTCIKNHAVPTNGDESKPKRMGLGCHVSFGKFSKSGVSSGRKTWLESMFYRSLSWQGPAHPLSLTQSKPRKQARLSLKAQTLVFSAWKPKPNLGCPARSSIVYNSLEVLFIIVSKVTRFYRNIALQCQIEPDKLNVSITPFFVEGQLNYIG